MSTQASGSLEAIEAENFVKGMRLAKAFHLFW